MRAPVDVSIIIVSYNTRDMTLAAIASAVRETRDVTSELIVVDNASSDGSAEAIATAFPDVRLIASPDNLGFAAGNNLAAAHARGEYLLLLNPDTVVLDCAVDRLVAFARSRPEAGIWGGRTLFADGRLNPASCWRRISLWNLFCRAAGLTGMLPRSALFNSEAYGGWARDRVREVDIVSGCFLLVRRDTWQRLGGFDPVFFMYGEEADLCLRARRIGARPHVTPEAKIVHHGGASETARADKLVKLLAAKASLVARHFHPRARTPGRLLLAAWPLSRWIALSVAARLSRARRHAEAAAVWRDIWRRRGEWLAGWRQATAVPPADTPTTGAVAHPGLRTWL